MLRLLTLIDERTRACLAILVARYNGAQEVIELLAEVLRVRGMPEHIRSDNVLNARPSSSPRRCANKLQRIGAITLYIEPGSPWENGYCQRFNGALSDDILDREIFHRLKEANLVIDRWRRETNEIRPHSALGYRPPGAGEL